MAFSWALWVSLGNYWTWGCHWNPWTYSLLVRSTSGLCTNKVHLTSEKRAVLLGTMTFNLWSGVELHWSAPRWGWDGIKFQASHLQYGRLLASYTTSSCLSFLTLKMIILAVPYHIKCMNNKRQVSVWHIITATNVSATSSCSNATILRESTPLP